MRRCMANKPKTAVVSELDIATQDNAIFDSEIDNPVNTEMGDTPRTPGGNPLRGMQELQAYTNMTIFGTAEEADNVEHLEEIRQQKKWCGSGLQRPGVQGGVFDPHEHLLLRS